MVGRRRPELLEMGAALLQCLDQRGVGANLDTRDGLEPLDMRVPPGSIQVDDGVWPKCRTDTRAPPGIAQSLMFCQLRGCRISCAQDFDTEALEQRLRRELRLCQLRF